MKKLSKILLIAASLCLLVAVLALAVSANTEPTVVGPFAVRDSEGTLVGYDTWAAAVDAAKLSGNDIILNEDYTVEPIERDTAIYHGAPTGGENAADTGVTATKAGLFVEGADVNLTLDLNGKKLTQTYDGSLFELYGATLTVKGAGTLDGVRTVARLNGASTLIFEANPIKINTVAHATAAQTSELIQQGCWTLFIAENGSNLKFTGKIDVALADYGTRIIRAYTAGSVVLDTCEFTIPAPKAAVTATSSLNEFLAVNDGSGTKIEIINSSKLFIESARVFNVDNKVGTRIDLTGWLNHFPVPKGLEEYPTAMAQGVTKYLGLTDADKVFITVKDSEIVSECEKLSRGSQSQGQILMCENCANLVFNAENSHFQGGSRVFWMASNAGSVHSYDAKSDSYGGNVNLTSPDDDYKYLIDPHQMYFKDCTFNRNAQNSVSNYLFVYGTNVIWEGGYIQNAGTVSSCSYFFEQLEEGALGKGLFYGVLFKDVMLSQNYKPASVPDDVKKVGLSNSWTGYWSYEGDNYTNYSVVKDGIVTTYPYAYSTVAPAYESDYSFIKYNTNIHSDSKLDYSSSYVKNVAEDETITYSTVTSGTSAFIASGSLTTGNTLDGTRRDVRDEFGNLYFQWDYSGTESIDANKSNGYLQLQPNDRTQQIYVKNVEENTTYWTVAEYDLNVKNMGNASNINGTMQPRVYTYQYDSNGNPIGGLQGKYNSTTKLPHTTWTGAGYTGASSHPYFYNTSSKGESIYVTLADGTRKTFGHDDWARVTIVTEYAFGEIANRDIRYFTAADTPAAEGETITKSCIRVTPRFHYFIDGEYYATADWGTYGYDGWVPVDGDSYLYQDGMRFTYNKWYKGEINVTNIRMIALTPDDGASFSDYFAEGGNLNGVEIKDGIYFCDMPKVLTANNTFAVVDGVAYATEDEAVGMLQDGSTMELFASLTKKLNVSGMNLIIKTNGYTIPGYYSADKVIDDYTASLGILKVHDADADEIVNYTFAYGTMAPQEQSAVVGTTLYIPDSFNPDSTDFQIPALRVDKGAEGVYFNAVTGWTLTEGTEGDHEVTSDKTVVYPVEDSVKAVLVKWDTDANLENGYEVVKEYNPAVNNELGEYPELIANITTTTHASGWYQLQTGYNPADVAKINLKVEGAEYTVASGQFITVYGEDDFRLPMYVNVTMLSHNRLNFYVPGTLVASGGADGTVIKDSAGNVLVKNITIKNVANNADVAAYGTTTIAGEEIGTWSRFSIYMGVDPVEYTVRVSFQTPDGQAITRDCTTSLAIYAGKVMEQPESERYSKEAKSLVMNMVNYSLKLYEAAGATMNEDGEALFLDIIENPDYAEFLATYDDELFLAGGDIYEAEVATLNKNEDYNPTEAIKFFDKVGMRFTTTEAIFKFRYSEYAEKDASANGIEYSQKWGHSSTGVSTMLRIGNSNTDGLTSQTYVVTNGSGYVDATDKNTSISDAIHNPGAYKTYDYWVETTTGYQTYYSWATAGQWTMSDFADRIYLEVYVDKTLSATYEYSVAAYVNQLLNIAEPTADDLVSLDVAKAFYSYAKAAYDYNGGC